MASEEFVQVRGPFWYFVTSLFFLRWELLVPPITVAARSKSWTVFTRSKVWIVGSNLTQGMDVCVRLFCVCVVLCVCSGLATGRSPVQGVLPAVYRIKKLKKWPKVQQRAVEPQSYRQIQVSRNLFKRIQTCLTADGRHFEHLVWWWIQY
jgi:hypothetical protein